MMAPFRALLSHRGPRMMLAVALIFSITSNLDKLGVERSSPVFWSLAVSVMITLILTPTLLMTRRRGQPHSPAPWGGLVLIGILIGLGTIVQMTAIQLTLVAYVIAIKRTSAMMTVFFGHYIFNEPGIRDRAIGTAVMVVGVVLITVFGR